MWEVAELQEDVFQMCARASAGVTEKMQAARVAVAGAGGLGSNLALLLARSGIGTLCIVDFDTVELSNLNRQAYDRRHLGMPKAEALAARIAEINPDVCVQAHCERVCEENVSRLFGGYPIVCEAFDRADQKSMLISALGARFPDTKIVGASGMGGYGSSNSIHTRRVLRNLYLCGDFESDMEEGVMAPRVMLCAAQQANMVMRLILGEEEA